MAGGRGGRRLPGGDEEVAVEHSGGSHHARVAEGRVSRAGTIIMRTIKASALLPT
jgi:hypothetical protein